MKAVCIQKGHICKGHLQFVYCKKLRRYVDLCEAHLEKDLLKPVTVQMFVLPAQIFYYPA